MKQTYTNRTSNFLPWTERLGSRSFHEVALCVYNCTKYAAGFPCPLFWLCMYLVLQTMPPLLQESSLALATAHEAESYKRGQGAFLVWDQVLQTPFHLLSTICAFACHVIFRNVISENARGSSLIFGIS